MSKKVIGGVISILILLVVGMYFGGIFDILLQPPLESGFNVKGQIIVGYEDGTEDIITSGTQFSMYYEGKRIKYVGFRPMIDIKTSWIPMSPHTSASIKIERWLYFDNTLVETFTEKTETMALNQWHYVPWLIFSYEDKEGHPKMNDLDNGEHLISAKYGFTAVVVDPDGKELVQYEEMGTKEIWGITVLRKDPYTLTIETKTATAVCGDGICSGPPILPYALETSISCPEDC